MKPSVPQVRGVGRRRRRNAVANSVRNSLLVIARILKKKTPVAQAAGVFYCLEISGRVVRGIAEGSPKQGDAGWVSASMMRSLHYGRDDSVVASRDDSVVASWDNSFVVSWDHSVVASRNEGLVVSRDESLVMDPDD